MRILIKKLRLKVKKINSSSYRSIYIMYIMMMTVDYVYDDNNDDDDDDDDEDDDGDDDNDDDDDDNDDDDDVDINENIMMITDNDDNDNDDEDDKGPAQRICPCQSPVSCAGAMGHGVLPVPKEQWFPRSSIKRRDFV